MCRRADVGKRVEWADRFRQHEKSGLTVAEFCHWAGVSVATFCNWRRKLADGSQVLEVRLDAPEVNGVKVAQVYKFTRGSYVIDVSYDVHNGSETTLQPHAYFQLVRDRKPPDGDSAMLPTYTGLAVYTKGEKFQKVAFDDVDKGKTPYSKTVQEEGWVAIVQHYFLSAVIPKDKTQREFYTSKLDGGLYAAGAKFVGPVIAAGAHASLGAPI